MKRSEIEVSLEKAQTDPKNTILLALPDGAYYLLRCLILHGSEP